MLFLFTFSAFSFLTLAVGILVGWLICRVILARHFEHKSSFFDFKLNELALHNQQLHEKIGLSEADLKKSQFDFSEIQTKLETAENQIDILKTNIEKHQKSAELATREYENLLEKSTAQTEQIEGLRAKLAQYSVQINYFLSKEEAEEQLHADFAAAVERSQMLINKTEKLEKENAKMYHKIESLETQLLDFQLKSVELPGLLSENTVIKKLKKSNRKNNGQSTENGIAQLASAPAEDLKIINNLSPKFELELHRYGITTISKLAALTSDQLQILAEGAQNLVDEMSKENWISQAQHLLQNKA
jgi:predicted flap endonuclease-1-like 5' DNA nuclease